MLKRAALILLFAILGPSAGAADAIDVWVSAGPTAGKASDVKLKALPAFRVRTVSELTKWAEWGPKLAVDVELTGLPSQKLDVEDPESVNALDGSISVLQGFGDTVKFKVYGQLGVSSRLSEDIVGVDRLPGYMSVGLYFHTESRAYWLKLGTGPDQRLSGRWAQCVHASGAARLTTVKNVTLSLEASVIRALDRGDGTPKRDWWSISPQVGWGSK
jgi:hypothetical protein